MAYIIDMTIEALGRIGITPEYEEDNFFIFSYGDWPCLCIMSRPCTVKLMVYLYCSKTLEWPSESFYVSVCKSVSNYKYNYEEFLHAGDGGLLVTTYITPPYSVHPIRQMQLQIESFFNNSVPRAKSYIEGIPELRNPLGQYMNWGWTTPQEKIKREGRWTNVCQYTEGLVAVADKLGRYGFLDASAEIAIPCLWADAQPFSEGLAAVQSSNGLWGFIDRTGKVVIPYAWHQVKRFSGGLAAVMSAEEEWGFIDTDAQLVIPCRWAVADMFRNGHARVWDNDGLSYFIDRHGVVKN